MTWLAETVMLSHGWRRFLILVAAGALAALSVAPWFLLPTLFVAMPIWVWALDGAEHRPGLGQVFGPAFGIGFAFGLGYFVVALHWLAVAFFQEGGAIVLLAPLAVLALAALLALFWGLASALAHRLWSTGALRVLTLGAVVALAEWGRGHLLSGFPFDLLGYALTANDQMSQLASVVGVDGLTLVAACLSPLPALIWPADQRNLVRRLVPLFVLVAAVAAQLGYGDWRLRSTPLSPRDDLRLRLVQPMVMEHVDWTSADADAIVSRLITLSQQAPPGGTAGLAGIDAVIWPESVFPFFLSQHPDALARLGRMLPEGTLLLTGAPREALSDDFTPIADNPGYNSILAINRQGETVASYDKSHLVPFGEYLPFQPFWRLFGISQFVPGTSGWAPGEGRRLMAPPGLPPFLALICYEAVFSGDIGDPAGAQFILNVTNDAWFMGSIGPAQHAHFARLRAVEAGLPLVRVGNSGVTMVTDPLGRIATRLAENQIATLDVSPDHRLEGGTLFGRWGDLPFWLGTLTLLGASAVAAGRRRHRG